MPNTPSLAPTESAQKNTFISNNKYAITLSVALAIIGAIGFAFAFHNILGIPAPVAGAVVGDIIGLAVGLYLDSVAARRKKKAVASKEAPVTTTELSHASDIRIGHRTSKQLTKQAAATKIQAAFRKYLEKQVAALTHWARKREMDLDPSLEDLVKQQAAATKIQAAFRGHLTRNKLAKELDLLKSNETEVSEKDNLDEQFSEVSDSNSTISLTFEREGRIYDKKMFIEEWLRDMNQLRQQDLSDLKLAIEERAATRAATTIQAVFRRSRECPVYALRQRCVRKILRDCHIYLPETDIHAQQLKYVTKMQAKHRGNIARTLLAQQTIAATRIQAAFRKWRCIPATQTRKAVRRAIPLQKAKALAVQAKQLQRAKEVEGRAAQQSCRRYNQRLR